MSPSNCLYLIPFGLKHFGFRHHQGQQFERNRFWRKDVGFLHQGFIQLEHDGVGHQLGLHQKQVWLKPI